ncbi:MAG: DUF465 domain-containing protein [Haliea sp.]|jgi:hypothetical protein|nr:DUF465 domain-containing protein [Haliea sp.]
MSDIPENGDGQNGEEEANEEAANEVLTPAMRLLDLQTKHRALDMKIAELHRFPYQNQILLQRLKKEKLRLKDAIERLKDEMIPDLNA